MIKLIIVDFLKWCLAKFDDKKAVVEVWPFPVPQEAKKKPVLKKATTRTVAKKTTTVAKKTTKKAK